LSFNREALPQEERAKVDKTSPGGEQGRHGDQPWFGSE
jgi:hypothetical protein